MSACQAIHSPKATYSVIESNDKPGEDNGKRYVLSWSIISHRLEASHDSSSGTAKEAVVVASLAGRSYPYHVYLDREVHVYIKQQKSQKHPAPPPCACPVPSRLVMAEPGLNSGCDRHSISPLTRGGGGIGRRGNKALFPNQCVFYVRGCIFFHKEEIYGFKRTLNPMQSPCRSQSCRAVLCDRCSRLGG